MFLLCFWLVSPNTLQSHRISNFLNFEVIIVVISLSLTFPEGIPALLDLDESDEHKCENVVILQIKRLLKAWEKILFKVVQVGEDLVWLWGVLTARRVISVEGRRNGNKRSRLHEFCSSRGRLRKNLLSRNYTARLVSCGDWWLFEVDLCIINMQWFWQTLTL